MALEHLRGQYRPLVRAYGVAEDAERARIGLIEEAEDFEDLYGQNYWLAVLYRGLAAEDAFCDGGFEVLRQWRWPETHAQGAHVLLSKKVQRPNHCGDPEYAWHERAKLATVLTPGSEK